MAAPANQYAFDIETAQRAAKNWQREKSKRKRDDRELASKHYDAVETKERLAKHANRLLGRMKQRVPVEREALSDSLRELLDRPPLREDEIDNVLMERVIGETRDFLSVEFLSRGLQVSRCVSRVVTNLGAGRIGFGTGFLVSPRLLLTNEHVLRTAETAARTTVEFDYQLDLLCQPRAVERFKLMPGEFFLNCKELDFALVAVNGTSEGGKRLSEYGWLPLIREEGKIIKGNPVNLIQHPRGEMKQIVIRENKLKDLLDIFAQYEADTEPGSSGSPVFNDQWEVIALHHSGVPKMDSKGKLLGADGRAWKKGDDPSRLAWEGNEGVRVSRLVKYIGEVKLTGREKQLRDDMLASGSLAGAHAVRGLTDTEAVCADGVCREKQVPVSPPVKRRDEDAAPPPDAMTTRVSGGAVTVEIPLSITVSLGTPGTASRNVETGLSGSAADAGFLEKIEPDPDYDSRPGYDSDLLGFSVPLPTLSSSIKNQAVAIPGAAGAGKYELKYHHYSVIMNKDRRLAFVAAVNYDADPSYEYDREGKDKWFYDPRIGDEFQAGEKLYQDNPLDRGHLVRRTDAAWGDTEEEAKLANDDTFHFTNCSPQHEVFNQSSKATKRGMQLWGNLENHISRQAGSNKKKLCIFNGPIFRANDRRHRGVKLPKEFWKVVVFEKEDGSRSAVAFLLSQASLIANLPEEEFQVEDYAAYQVKVRDIGRKTKLKFGNLPNHDPLEAEGAEAFFEAGTEAVALANVEDAVL
ncbi:MAG: DNA/RNA non-specific endonuclease [Candidatus Eisenbacteria bacterium]